MRLRFTQILVVAVLCLSASWTASAQTTITGTVTSAENNEPLIGVTILVKGTQTGTVTDLDGFFEITANQGDVLVLSYTGMQGQEFEVGTQTNLTIQLQPSSMVLEEVVVTGYGEQSRTTFTGASTNVATEKIENAPRVSFQESLQGNVPGLFLTQNNGQPGANQQVRIRGIGSLAASAEPLYVIDGIPVLAGNTSGDAFSQANTIAGLNPNDIKSITVLKDASATSIYGSRGANGVIVIQTKTGSRGKPRVTLNFSGGVNVPTLTDRNRPLNTDEYLELQYEGVINAGLADNLADAQQYIWDRLPDESFIGGRPGPGEIPNIVNTDWFDEVTRTGSYITGGASVQGGDERFTYFLSGSYTDNQGTIIGSEYEKYTAALGITTKMSEWLDVGANLNYSQQNLETQAGGGFFANPVRAMYRLVPWAPVFNEDGSYFTGINSTYNPIGIAEENFNLTFLNSFLGSINAKVKLPLKGLSYEPRFSFNQITTEEQQWNNPDFGGGRNVNGSADWRNRKDVNWIITNLIKYSTFINDAHGIDVTVGHEAQRQDQNILRAFNQNFPVPGLETPSNGSEPQVSDGSITGNRLLSYLATASYNYKGLFYVNGTFRRDGSSRFGSDVRFANFWSVGASVNLDRFAFLTGNNLITKLRVRSSYGTNGNQQGIGNFESRGLYTSGADYAGNPGIRLNQLENAALTWEKNNPFNLGVEVGLWNRIFVNADYYNRLTSSLIFDVPVSRTNGVTTVTSNSGEIKNEGVELAVTTFNIQNPSGFNWNTEFNITFNRATFTSLPEDNQITGNFIRSVGDEVQTIWAPGYIGADPDTGDPLWWTDSTMTETTSNYSEAARFRQGTVNPDYFGGITNTLSWKGLTLSFQFNFVVGGQVYDNWTGFTHTDGRRGLNTTGNLARKIFEDRWQQPGDQTNVPRFVFLNGSNSQAFSTRYYYDGTFVRLRDLTLSYSLPTRITSKLKMRNIQVYFRSNNLWTWIKDDGLERDPQADANGDLDQEIPVPRTFVGGIEISF